MSAVQVAPSGERSQGRGNYMVKFAGATLCDPYLSALSWSFTKGAIQVRFTYLYLFPESYGLACWSYCSPQHGIRTSIGTESFTDLDFAVDVAEMLSVLVLALEIVDEKRNACMGLTINWSKTKIHPIAWLHYSW